MQPRLAAHGFALPTLIRQCQEGALVPQPHGEVEKPWTLESDPWVPALTLALTNCVTQASYQTCVSLVSSSGDNRIDLQGFCEDEVR